MISVPLAIPSRETKSVKALLASVWLIFAAGPVALALDPSRAFTQYVHRSWSGSGVPETSLTAIAQTPDGYLWIATEDMGLARYDGAAFSHFDKSTTSQLPDDAVFGLFVDRQGALWIATDGGMTVYRDGRFKTVGLGDGLPQQRFTFASQTTDGDIWVGGGEHLFHGHQGVFRERVLPFHVTGIRAFAATQRGLWIGTASGLVLLSGQNAERFTTTDGLPSNEVTALRADGDALWIGTQRGAVYWGGGAFRKLPKELGSTQIWAIACDRDGSTWFATRSGLMRLRGDDLAVFKELHGLSNNWIKSVFEDADGSLWLGGGLGTLDQFRAGPVTTYSRSEGLPAQAVWSVFDDRHGDVWIGMEEGGLARLSRGTLKAIDLPSRRITAITGEADGTLWVGTGDRGVLRLRGGIWTSITTREGLCDDAITTLEVDGNALWVGTEYGLSRVEQGHIRSFALRDGLPEEWVHTTHRDRSGRFWVGTEKGLAWLDGEHFVSQLGSIPLPKQRINFIHEDARGWLWIGSHAGLLSISPAGIVRRLTTRDGLPRDEIVSIHEDRHGNFWISTGDGVFSVPRAALEQGRIIRPPTILGTADGMKSSAIMYGDQPSSRTAADGSIWYATFRGAARLDPDAAAHRPAHPWPLIESILVDGRSEKGDGPLDIAPGAEKLEFHYAAPSLIAPERIRFQYQLEGYDHDWIEAGTRRIAFYTHLPPGQYRFRVKVDDGWGWSAQKETATRLLLRPRFSQTPWFFAVLAAVAALAAAVVYLLRMNRIHAEYAAVMTERNRIAREFHDTLAQGLAGLSYQLASASKAVGDAPDFAVVRRSLETATAVARNCLSETRRSLLDLRPDILERGDLARAIQAVASEVGDSASIPVRAFVSGKPRRLERCVEQHMLRIAQESVANAVRHSGARKVEIRLTFTDDQIELSVIDDGKGPPSLTDSDPLRFGIVGIVERAEEIGGRLTVTGRRGEGTTVRLTVPLRSNRRIANVLWGAVGWKEAP
jgi:signal transduction histidine kinase/ligand-binding sensor domain-containing protein